MRLDKTQLIAAAAVVALVAGGVWAWHTFSGGNALPEGSIQATHCIEGDHTTVASKHLLYTYIL